MLENLPTFEKCKECGEYKTTVWEKGEMINGFTINQTHKSTCSILADLRKKYTSTYYPSNS